MILIRDNNGNQRFSFYFHMTSVPSRAFCQLYICPDSRTFIVCFYRPFSCFKSISFTFRIGRCGIHMTSPVIKDSWNMNNPFRLLAAAKDQVKILCSVIFPAKCSCLIQNRSFYHENMTDIIILSESEQVKIRFKVWLKVMLSIHTDLIFIRIDRICFFLSDRLYNMKKCIRRKNIIVIAEHDILSHCKLNGCICIFGNTFVFFQLLIRDADFLFVFFSQEFADFISLAAVCQT